MQKELNNKYIKNFRLCLRRFFNSSAVQTSIQNIITKEKNMADEQQDQQQVEQIKKIVEETVQKEMKKNGSGQKQGSSLLKEEQQAAIDCVNAYNIALQVVHYAAQMGGNMTSPETLNTLRDCAEFCMLMNNLILRQSKYKADFGEVCFRACMDAVHLAENFTEDKQMQNLLQYAKQASESVKQVK